MAASVADKIKKRLDGFNPNLQHTDLEDVPVLKLSSRISVRPGDFVRVSGGPTHRGKALGPRGRFRIVDIVRSVWGRIYIDAVRIDQDGLAAGLYTLFVSGKPYRRSAIPHVIFRPHNLTRLK